MKRELRQWEGWSAFERSDKVDDGEADSRKELLGEREAEARKREADVLVFKARHLRAEDLLHFPWAYIHESDLAACD